MANRNNRNCFLKKSIFISFLVTIFILVSLSSSATVYTRLKITAPDTVYAGEEFWVTVTLEGRPFQGAEIGIGPPEIKGYGIWGSQYRTGVHIDPKYLTDRNGKLNISIMEEGQNLLRASDHYTWDKPINERVGVSESIIVTVLPSGSEGDLTPTPTILSPSPIPSLTPTPEEKGVPGFEALFVIAGLLAVAHIFRRRR